MFRLALLLLLATAAAHAKEVASLSLDDPAKIGLRIEQDTEVKSEGEASLRITTPWPTTVCLGQVADPMKGHDGSPVRLMYSLKVKTELKSGVVTPEMWARVSGGEYFSRNPAVVAADTTDWKVLEIPFQFQQGQTPDRLTLNLIIQGMGRVWVDDVRLRTESLAPPAGEAQP